MRGREILFRASSLVTLGAGGVACGPRTPDIADTINLKCEVDANAQVIEEVILNNGGQVKLGERSIKIKSPGVWYLPGDTGLTNIPDGQDVLLTDGYYRPLGKSMVFRVESQIDWGDKTIIRIAHNCADPQNPQEFLQPESRGRSVPHTSSYKGFGLNR